MKEFTGKVVGIENYTVKGELEAQMIQVGAKPVSFKPGQYLMISDNTYKLRTDDTKLKWTPYSVCTSPLDKGLEFIYTVKKTGGFTQHLAETLKVGATLNFKGPLGNFILDENKKEKIFVATGAGISPIMSMVRTLAKKGEKATLFYGFRTGEHFLYRKVLEKLATQGKLTLRATISREDPKWKGEHGYVQILLKDEKLSQEKQDVYICGSATMVTEVRKLLLDKGFPETSVKREQW